MKFAFFFFPLWTLCGSVSFWFIIRLMYDTRNFCSLLSRVRCHSIHLILCSLLACARLSFRENGLKHDLNLFAWPIHARAKQMVSNGLFHFSFPSIALLLSFSLFPSICYSCQLFFCYVNEWNASCMRLWIECYAMSCWSLLVWFFNVFYHFDLLYRWNS